MNRTIVTKQELKEFEAKSIQIIYGGIKRLPAVSYCFGNGKGVTVRYLRGNWVLATPEEDASMTLVTVKKCNK